MVLDMGVEERPCRRRSAEPLKEERGHVIVEIVAGLVKPDPKGPGLVIVGDVIDHRGLSEAVRAHILPSARGSGSFPAQTRSDCIFGKEANAEFDSRRKSDFGSVAPDFH